MSCDECTCKQCTTAPEDFKAMKDPEDWGSSPLTRKAAEQGPGLNIPKYGIWGSGVTMPPIVTSNNTSSRYEFSNCAFQSTMVVVPTALYKYKEPEHLQELASYLGGTYAGHYIGENNVQCFDVWDALKSAETTHRDTAIKYLMRYGKKDGRNRKDILKAIHYCFLLLYYNGKE